MYLPAELPNAKVLITVKTYPRPTSTYNEIVCTAGFLDNGKWIRIYPIPFRDLPFSKQFNKFHWIQLNLEKTSTDFRSESYRPKLMFEEPITLLNHIDTKEQWFERKNYVLNEVFTSMEEILKLAYDDNNRSLATLKPKEIIEFIDEEEKEREWGEKLSATLNQMNFLGSTKTSQKSIIKKLPYRYYYRFKTEDNKTRKLQILDWEIGALFWKCLQNTEGDEIAANNLVRQKYFNEFLKKDLFFFLGSTYTHHVKKAKNPFSIIGVFPPPKTQQIALPL